MLGLFSSVLITSFARASPPSPPFAQTCERANLQFLSSQKFFTKSVSAFVSVRKELSVTTTGTPYFCIFSMCFSRLTIPFLRASRFSSPRFFLSTPPLYLRALIVATRTTASGLRPAILHLISRNFSAPRSAPKPASVTV